MCAHLCVCVSARGARLAKTEGRLGRKVNIMGNARQLDINFAVNI